WRYPAVHDGRTDAEHPSEDLTDTEQALAIPGIFGTRWHPWREGGATVFPYLSQRLSLPIFSGTGQQYGEAKLPSPGYVGFCQMNYLSTHEESSRAYRVLRKLTPDFTGNAHTGLLEGGAAFSQDFAGAGTDRWVANAETNPRFPTQRHENVCPPTPGKHCF